MNIHQQRWDAPAKELWTDERVKLLKQLWEIGDSCSEIAASLGGGVTRNAIIGKVHRLGLTKRLDPNAPRAKRSVPNDTRGKFARIAHNIKKRESERTLDGSLPPDSAAAEYEAAPIPKEFLGIGLLDLTDSTCRFPRGEDKDTRFCGQQPMKGSPYCPTCHRICYTAPASRMISPEERARRSASARRAWELRGEAL